MENNEVYDRLRTARKFRGKTQEDIAGLFGWKKQTYGAKENGNEGGLNPDRLKVVLDELQIDARYIFCQIDDIEKADLTKPENVTDKQEMIEEMYESWKMQKEEELQKDKYYSRLQTDKLLRDCVDLLIQDRSAIQEVMGYLKISKALNQKGEAAVG